MYLFLYVFIHVMPVPDCLRELGFAVFYAVFHRRLTFFTVNICHGSWALKSLAHIDS